MTAPTFQPIPIPSDSALVRMPPPATSQAGVIDANFALINPWISKVAKAWTWQLPQAQLLNASATSDMWSWHPFGGYWGSLSFNVPDASMLIVAIAGRFDYMAPGAFGALTAIAYGQGLAGYSGQATAQALVECEFADRYLTCGSQQLFVRSYLNVGSAVTLTPHYMLSIGSAIIYSGSLTVMAVR